MTTPSRLRRAAALAVAPLALAAGLLTACQPESNADCNSATYYPGADLSATDQSNKQLLSCDLSGIDFSNATFTGAILRDANLQGTDLSGADLTGMTFNEANMKGVNLEGTVLAGANLAFVSSGNVTGTPASLPARWIIDSGYLMGPGANLVGFKPAFDFIAKTDLTYANMARAHLNLVIVDRSDWSNIYLAGAELGGTDLTRVTLRGANFTGANADYVKTDTQDLTGAIFVNTSLVGAQLWNANLTGADLSGANLAGADLDGSDLTGANLTGADLTGASLVSITWSNTTCPNGQNSDTQGGTC